MASGLSGDTLDLITQMKSLNQKLSQDDARSDSQNRAQAAVLGQFAKLASDKEQRRVLVWS
jgi:hypothetical protein